MKRYQLELKGIYKNGESYAVFYDKVNNCAVLDTPKSLPIDLADGWLDELLAETSKITEIGEYFKENCADGALDWVSLWM